MRSIYRDFIKQYKHRKKLSVAIPINNEAYEVLKQLWKLGDLDMGDTILRIYRNSIYYKDSLDVGV